ncbi:MAG TPA: BON domain-containing protein [Burkholderiales bacterium]|jgi:osmotically-inducible protein OsmY
MNRTSRMPKHPSRTLVVALAAAAALAVLAGCSSTPTQESAGEYFDNSLITAKVKSALLGTEDLSSGNISVASFKGKVQLSGFVPTETDKQRAEVIARDVEGVKVVTNAIEIKGQ